MPTITFELKDFEKLVGKNITINQLSELVSYGKGSLEKYDKETDEVNVDFGDTNLPYLWSVEGVARLIKGVLGLEKGIPKLIINRSNYNLIVDDSVESVRPYIAAFVAKGKKVNDYLIKQIIQLQEKLCENYGRKRQKVAIGIYSQKKITYPIYYKATDPESVKFIPLEFKREMTQGEILESHPKGQEYAWILVGYKKYPLLMDSKKEVLSFPPIINSNTTGKVDANDDELFFEATGTDLDAVLLATNIFAQAFYDRGFKIYSVNVKYKNKIMVTPKLFNETIKVKREDIKNLIGLDLKETEIKELLEKARYNFNKFEVDIPSYRRDIMHPFDVVEDVAVMYGFDNIKGLPLKARTVGETFAIKRFIDKIREIMVGLGYQEVMSPILSNKDIIYKKMESEDKGTIEIKNYMSETYSVVRTSILPILMQVLSKNKHIEYPQKIFEQGLITIRRDNFIKDYEFLAMVSIHNNASFTEAKQAVDYLFRMLSIKYEVKESKHDGFIEGRTACIEFKGKRVACFGEIHPKVLENFGLEVPVAAFEINLTRLFDFMQKA